MKPSLKRPLAVGAALVLPCLLPGAVVAQNPVTTVTAPSGGMMPSGAPFTVQWISPGPGTIQISLVAVGAINPLANLASSLPNNGQAQVSLPATFECDPQQFYKIRVNRYYSTNNNYYHHNITGESAPLKVTCPITVTKQVVNTTGRPAGGAFRMRVQCEPGSQTIGNILASGQGSFTRKIHVPAGSTTCTVQETGMPMTPIGCNWLTTYPGGQQRQPGGPPVIVVNTLQCGATTPPDRRP